MSWIFEMGHIKHAHFVGIGGVGMGGIAEVLLRLGYTVSGSDIAENALTQWLRVMGATIFIGHRAENLQGAQVVIRSSAIKENNPEIIVAKQKRIPIVARSEMLGELMRFRYGIAIAGTHGKTTTTSLITSILAHAEMDPTFVIGGKLNSAGSNARLGKGRYLIAEADESDASFLYLKPMMSVVTNIDLDHMETYQNNVDTLHEAYISFIHGLPFYGLSVLCIDDEGVRSILPKLSRPILTYGMCVEADVKTFSYTKQATCTEFVVERQRQLPPLEITLNLPGRHNVLNALAAIAIATELNIPDRIIQEALAQFSGIGRRFQIYGELSLPNGGVATLIDDYGHHPREIIATIQAAREVWPEKRLVMVYQPHRFTRTRDLFNDFCSALTKVDDLILLEVYSAGELPIEGADSAHLAVAISNIGQLKPALLTQVSALSGLLMQRLQDNDILLMQGAGNIGGLAMQLAAVGLETVNAMAI